MLVESLIRVGVWLRPVRYAVEAVTYRLFYKAPDPSLELMAWKDRFKGRPMLVVGNGPSINQTPLEEFAHVPSVGMNKIDILFSRSSWRPTVILSMADTVILQHWHAWLKLDIPVFLNWKSRWMVPSKARRRFPYFLTLNDREFSPDFAHGVGRGFSVTYSALHFAYWCGANPVILFGVDHNFVQSDKLNVYERRVGADLNHFDPNYFPPGVLVGLANLEENATDYRNARIGFEADGRRILDATVGGRLDVFPKITLDEVREILRKE